jgi:hypothetical protein
VPTAPGVPDGEPSSAFIGAEGGSLESSDALLTVTIPAGALAAGVAIEIQPLANTAWGGLGKGYRLSPNGLAFAAPVALAFTIPEDTAGSIPAAFLDAAVQDDEGYWSTLRDVTVDAGTLTAQIRHFSDYSLISGAQIRPAETMVQTGETVELAILHCAFEAIAGDPDLTALVASCDEEDAPLGTFEGWMASAGTVVPRRERAARRLHGPGDRAEREPGGGRVRARFRQRQELLVSNITVTGGAAWSGTSVYTWPDGPTVTSDVTWTFSEPNGANSRFLPSGRMVYVPPPMVGDCASESVTPSEYSIGSGDGFLSVANDLTGYTGAGSATWPATVCVRCPGQPVTCEEGRVGGLFMAATGVVSENPTRIAGTADFGGGLTLTYSFLKTTP